MSANTPSPFISGTDMFTAYTRGERMTVIDSHWHNSENSAWEAYVSQHIPGAMFCDPLRHLAGIPSRQHGRNPLPSVASVRRHFADWGIMTDRPVYIYDAGSNLYAGRAWWIFRWAGVQDVRILNGGTPQWEAAGGDVAGGIGALRGRGDHTVTPDSMPQIFLEDVPEWVEKKILIDAREESRYQGRTEPYDHQGGHIPGAINIPITRLIDGNGCIAQPGVVREVLAHRGITSGENVAVYSGSGLHSSLFIAAMEHAGLPGAHHYVGGWSQWSADFSRPTERGAGRTAV